MTSEPYRIGVLGLTHDHVWGVLESFPRDGSARLLAAADPHAALRRKFEQATGRPSYDDPERLLEAEDPDAVFVYSDNRESVELACKAAAGGRHVMIEKPLAADLEGARRLTAAAAGNDIRLMVNWPFAWWPQLGHALAMARDGQVGRLWQVKYRAAHAGPREMGCSEFFTEWLDDPHRNGGGAYIDYCCYGALLARTLLGIPQRVTALTGRLVREDTEADDNGVLLMGYPHAIGVAEASWTQVGKLSAYVTMIYGTEGTLLVEPRLGGRLLLATADEPKGRTIEVPQPEPQRAAPAAHFVHCLQSGEGFTPLCRPEPALDVQEILDRGYAASSRAGS